MRAVTDASRYSRVPTCCNRFFLSVHTLSRSCCDPLANDDGHRGVEYVFSDSLRLPNEPVTAAMTPRCQPHSCRFNSEYHFPHCRQTARKLSFGIPKSCIRARRFRVNADQRSSTPRAEIADDLFRALERALHPEARRIPCRASQVASKRAAGLPLSLHNLALHE